MDKVDRRSALAIGLAAASATFVKPAASQTADTLTGKDTSPYPGVVVRAYGESPSLIPGFKTVSMRDIIMQPGSKTASPPMLSPKERCGSTRKERSLRPRRTSSGPAIRTRKSKHTTMGTWSRL